MSLSRVYLVIGKSLNMRASRMMMSFDPKTLPCAHRVRLCHKAKLSHLPGRLLRNQTLSRQPTKQDLFCVMATGWRS